MPDGEIDERATLLEFEGKRTLSTGFLADGALGLTLRLAHPADPVTSFPIRITSDAGLSPIVGRDGTGGLMHGALGVR